MGRVDGPVRAIVRTALGAVVAVVVVSGCGDSTGSGTTDAGTATLAAPGGAACTPAGPGTVRLRAIDGRVPVRLHVPPRPAAGAPLVLGLHGSGQTGEDFERYTAYSRLADREGFFVAYPTATGTRPVWNIATRPGKPDDVAYLRKVIGAAREATCDERRRVAVTGVSNGGGMTARLACDAAQDIVAVAPVAGGYSSLPACRPERPVPLLEIHGTADTVVPYDGRGADHAGSVARLLAQWRRLDRCPRQAARQQAGRRVTELRWAPCAAGSAVVHDRIVGGVHGWLGGKDIDGSASFATTARTWRFLSAFMPSPG